MGDARATAALVAQGARVRPTWSAVHEAAAAGGDLEVLRLLVAHGLQLEARDVYGKSFAHHLPAVEVLQMLPRSGLEAVDSQGVTVGHEAAMRGHVASVQLLREAGVSLLARASNGVTAGHFAAADGHVGVLRQLPWEALAAVDDAQGGLAHHAASQGHTAAVAHLLDAALPAEPDAQGRTLMHEAAATGYPEVLEELHSRGYDPRAVDRRGRSVAQLAAENGHLEVLKQLLAWQAVPKLRKKHISNREVLDFLKTSEL